MKKTLTAAAANEGFFKKYGFYLALLVLCVIVSLPTPDGLSVAGHRMLGIMVFSVIVWATTAISYPVSAGVIIALMALLIGFAPNPATGKIFGTAAGLASAIIPIIISVLAAVQDSWRQCHRHDDDSAIRCQLRLHPACQRAAKYDCLRHEHL